MLLERHVLPRARGATRRPMQDVQALLKVEDSRPSR